MALNTALICAGLVLLLLETVLPGLIAGVLGLLCLGASVVFAFMDFGTQTGSLVLMIVMALLAAGAVIWVKFFPDSPMARMFISHGQIGTVHAEKPELLGQTGTAQTMLRPSGSATINGRRVDVVSEGAFIEKGKPIKVMAIEGLRVVVRELNEGTL